MEKFQLLALASTLVVSFGAEPKYPLSTLNTNDLLNHIRVLSSDEFEGRAPGTPGERVA